MDDPAPSTSHEWQRRWPIALALNLIVPVLMAGALPGGCGPLGIAAGIGLIWYLGHRLCALQSGVGRALVIGGYIVALSQICPLLQMAAGLLGIGVARALCQGDLAIFDDGQIPGVTDLGGLIATMTTGVVLTLTALAIGGFITMTRPRQPVVRVVPLLYDRQVDG